MLKLNLPSLLEGMYEKAKGSLQSHESQLRMAPLSAPLHTETFQHKVPEMKQGLPILCLAPHQKHASGRACDRHTLCSLYSA